MSRREALDNIFKDIDENKKTLVNNLIDEVIFLEESMFKLRQLPFIRIHPKDLSKQEVTKSAKQYKDFSQSYMNAIRILCSLLNNDEGGEESPLRQYVKELVNKYE